MQSFHPPFNSLHYLHKWTTDPLENFSRVVPTALARPLGEVFHAADHELYETEDLSVGEVGLRKACVLNIQTTFPIRT